MRRTLPLILLVSLFVSTDAYAWDYLEHSWFTDISCHEAQRVLAEGLDTSNDQMVARYVALSLFCPTDWDKPYCSDKKKSARGNINDPESKGHSVTLGDYSALGDHVTNFGPVPGFERALDDGLVMRTFEWLMKPTGSAGGVIEDVAEEACITDLADFRGARGDVAFELEKLRAANGYQEFSSRLLQPGVRAAPILGPADPTVTYSINNPKYLDMVVRNHTHFGHQAYAAWLGFHSTALQIARRPCADVVPLDEDILADLASYSDDWEAVDWSAFEGRQRALNACHMLGGAVSQRVQSWTKTAAPDILKPALPWLVKFDANKAQMVLTASVALVMEGAGLHFLQDGLASGHMRTIRSREALTAVRHDHDSDNQGGVVARVQTGTGTHKFYAFGDTYLLSKSHIPGCTMDWTTLTGVQHLIPEVVTSCTIQHQRGLLAAAGSASLVDFVLDGPSFEDSAVIDEERIGSPERRACPDINTALGWVCRTLPLNAPEVSGEPETIIPSQLTYGALPVPHPPYSYESLSVRAGLEVQSNSPQIGLVLSFLEEMDTEGHWMKDWRFGLTTTFGEDKDNQWILDTSYSFHYRFSARVMLDMGPFLYVGLRDLNQDVEFAAGIGPIFGVTFLPEGWLRMPLELAITYQVPLTFYASKSGFFQDNVVEDHWLQFGVGLAFSH